MRHVGNKIKAVVLWLEQYTGYGIYDADTVRRDWAKVVALDRPQWPEHTYEETVREMQSRHWSNELWGRKTALYVWGHELSRCIALEYCGFISQRQDIGAQYWDHLKALRNAEMIATMV